MRRNLPPESNSHILIRVAFVRYEQLQALPVLGLCCGYDLIRKELRSVRLPNFPCLPWKGFESSPGVTCAT